MKFIYFLLMILITSVFMGACSGSLNPVSIQEELSPGISALVTPGSIPISVSDRFSDGYPAGGSGVLGLYTLYIDRTQADAQLIPLRSGASMDAMEFVDITNYLAMLPCRDCARIGAIGIDSDSNLEITIGIRHPFDKGDPSKTISGKNGADLHLFNVEGYLISDIPGKAFPSMSESLPGLVLVNADGYSKYPDTPIDEIFSTPATMHPYKLHFRDYSAGNFSSSYPKGFASVTDPPPSGNLVMPMGSDYDYRTYILDLPVQSVNILFAIGCSYGVSAENLNQRFIPVYRVPQFNKKAASEVQVKVISNEMIVSNASSSAVLGIDVLDISHGVATGVQMSQMRADSSVKSLTVDIPGVTLNPVVVSSPAATGGNSRDPLHPLTFQVTVTNSALGAEGIYDGLVKVLDSYAPGSNTIPSLSGYDGIKRVAPGQSPLVGAYEIDEFATFATFKIEVVTELQSDPPVAVISSPCPVMEVQVNTSLFFDGRLSHDDTPPIRGIAWDLDWDGDPANFDSDNTEDHFNHLFDTVGDYKIGLRVKDRENQFDYASVDVSVVDEAEREWFGSVLLSNMNGQETTERNISPSQAIVVDCAGVVHVAYKFITNGTQPTGIYYVNYNGVSVTAPLMLDNGVDLPYQPSLRIDGLGNLHLVYADDGEICYRKRTGATWSAREVIVPSDVVPTYIVEYPSMAVNYRGEMMVVYSNANYDIPKTYLAYVTNDGTGWSSPANLTERFIATSPTSFLKPEESVTADPDGRFHLVFNGWPLKDEPDVYRFWHGIYESGSWGPLTIFNQENYVAYTLTSYMALDGDLFVAYQSNRAGTIAAMYQRYNGLTGTWALPRLVTTDSINISPSVAVDLRGNVSYVWERSNIICYKTFNELASGPAIQNATTYEIGTGAWGRFAPEIFLEQNCRLHLIYEDDRMDPGHEEGRNLYYDVLK